MTGPPQRQLRIGQGIDIHPFVEGRALIIGGVKIPYEYGLAGHSDADVLLHAVIDALLGATGAGDIGVLYPNTDQRWKDIDSRILLKDVWHRIKGAGWAVINLDCTILAEAPKIRPYVQQMQCSIGEILEIAPDSCNIKATTAEKMGFVGRGEGIVATVVALLERL